ncbi:MAG: STAS domain-containing protein [Thermodesulfobacteriota bacterium]
MLIEKRLEHGVTAARVNSPRIEARIADQLAEGLIEAYRPTHAIAIDFSKVDFIDSTGMKAIMTVLLHCRKTEGACVLHGVSEDIMSIFVITRLHKLIPIVDSEEEAIRMARSIAEENLRRTNAI